MKSPYSIEKMKGLAKSRDGECLSKRYNGLKSKLLWQCKHGHIWEATPNSVLYLKSWCPECAGNKKIKLEEIKQIAEKKGGKCISNRFINSKSKLVWECKKGHQWNASVFSVKTRDSWCPVCNKIINQKIKRYEEVR